ncbi:hypothetical protein MHAE_15324 [Mycobacterium haemophilum DSM 44634]
MFVIRLTDGEEVQASDRDELTINQETGVLTVTRIDGFEKPPHTIHHRRGSP